MSYVIIAEVHLARLTYTGTPDRSTMALMFTQLATTLESTSQTIGVDFPLAIPCTYSG